MMQHFCSLTDDVVYEATVIFSSADYLKHFKTFLFQESFPDIVF